MEIKNKIIVITGGANGLGSALSNLLLMKGNKIIIADRLIKKNQKRLNKDLCTIKTDVTEESDVKKVTDFVVKKFKRIDIWINNAGVWLPHAPIEEISARKVRFLLDVNFFGVFFGSKYALMQMRKQKKGIIVNILSSSALDGGAGSSGYCASKFAASGFTKCLRLETDKDGIAVVSVYPRGMKTNFFNEKRPQAYSNFMDPSYVAKKIIRNLESENPKRDLIINH
jgi:NAD(P)-dependent dehydrogenase (short-subunit alcohol dehydrogenase family)